MLNEDFLSLIVCTIVLLSFIGLVIYIVHIFPVQVFIIFSIGIIALLSNEINYIK